MTTGREGAGPAPGDARRLDALVDALAARGEAPALVVFGPDDARVMTGKALADQALRVARGLLRAGLTPGDHVALLAANRPEWVICCLGILRAGGVAVPLDAQFGDRALAHVLADCEARMVFTAGATTERLARVEGLPEALRIVRLDAAEEEADGWQSLAAGGDAGEPLAPAGGDPGRVAVVFYTSGTTGAPKGVPLTHRNIGFQLETVRALGVLRPDDRVCLPLPLHHVYPFVIGLLLPLELGLPVVMPHALTGPQLVRALREGEASVVIGVPRLYRALADGIEAQAAAGGRVKRAVFGLLLGVSAAGHRLGLRWGKRLLRPVHARFGPALRLLACGGAPLSEPVARRLEVLGWRVATGYGLTETSPLLSLDVPPRTRLGSAGRVVPGVSLRVVPVERDTREAEGPGQDVAATDTADAATRTPRRTGEIQARGPNVFSGYRGLPDATAAAFTQDGWFRTGDLGSFDADGWLHVEGRASTLIVLEGGENVQPDAIEEAYAEHPVIGEIGVFLREGRLAGLVVADRGRIAPPPSAGAGEAGAGPPAQAVEDAVRAAVAERDRDLPSYQRLAEVLVTRDALPRTRLGKLRRHELPERYERARAEREQGPRRALGPMPPEEMSDDDRALLDDRAARRVWAWLGARHADVRLSPDTSPSLDLGIDSMGWLDLSLEVGRLTGVELDDAAIARIETVRDLLRTVAEAGAAGGGGVGVRLERLLAAPEQVLDARGRAILAEPGAVQSAAARAVYAFNRIAMRALFRVRAEGVERVPGAGPCLITPNHTSYLDPFAMAAVLPPEVRGRLHFAGWTGQAFRNPVTRLGSRLARAIPIERGRGAASSLALGAAVLRRGDALIWFPEGTRSRSGRLQRLQPGAGMLLAHVDVPVVPVAIHGAYEALPPGRSLPSPRAIRVVFGEPVEPDLLAEEGEGDDRHARILSALRARLEALLAQE